MRIAYIINHLGPSGVNQVVADLVSVFTAHGHECVVYYLRESDTPMGYACNTVYLRTVTDIVGTFDVVHAHGLGPMLYVARHKHDLAKRNGEQCRPLFITTLHCYCFQDLPSLYGWIKGGLMAFAYLWSTLWQDRVVCLSKDMMNYYSRWIKRSKLRYVYNTRILPSQKDITYDADDLKLVENLKVWHETGYHVIGMNGVLIYRKGVDLMLLALKQLNQSKDQYRLVLVGDGKDEEDFVMLCDSLGLRGQVLFAGHRRDAYRFLPYYDVLAMPSLSEGFPLSLLEAAAYGARVVISDLPIVKECFIEKARFPFCVNSAVSVFELSSNQNDNVKKIAQAVSKAIADVNAGSRIRSLFLEKFAPEMFYEKYKITIQK